jgi:hypothetical protein
VTGTVYMAATKHGAAQHFQTPYEAMSALLDTDGHTDVYVQTGDRRGHLLHRNANGVWSAPRQNPAHRRAAG